MIKNATKQLVPALSIGAGAIAQGYAANLIPIENALAKNGVTFVAGLILAGQKNKMLSGLGLGMAGASIQATAKTFGIGAIEDPVLGIDDLDDEDEEINGVDNPIFGEEEEN